MKMFVKGISTKDFPKNFLGGTSYKTREIPISGKWKNRNFGYKIVISVKNPKFILWISDDGTDFTIGIDSRNLVST